jgi:hypothetical protein
MSENFVIQIAVPVRAVDTGEKALGLESYLVACANDWLRVEGTKVDGKPLDVAAANTFIEVGRS